MSATERPRALAFGGGVQSSALVALLGRGEYPGAPPQEVWFCNPGNERPQTYAWITRVIEPYCARLGVPFLWLYHRDHKVYGAETLLENYRRRQQYPLRTNRQCTVDYKVRVMEAEARRRGWDKTCGVEKHIGISLDELHRAKTGLESDWEVKRYPLIEARLFRDDCIRICQDTFGDVPVKSGCWFCKYQRPAQWREVYEQRADGRWALAVAWEREVMAKHGTVGAFIDARIGGKNIPLDEWAKRWDMGEQLPLDLEPAAACDGGYCLV